MTLDLGSPTVDAAADMYKSRRSSLAIYQKKAIEQNNKFGAKSYEAPKLDDQKGATMSQQNTSNGAAEY